MGCHTFKTNPICSESKKCWKESPRSEKTVCCCAIGNHRWNKTTCGHCSEGNKSQAASGVFNLTLPAKNNTHLYGKVSRWAAGMYTARERSISNVRGKIKVYLFSCHQCYSVRPRVSLSEFFKGLICNSGLYRFTYSLIKAVLVVIWLFKLLKWCSVIGGRLVPAQQFVNSAATQWVATWAFK